MCFIVARGLKQTPKQMSRCPCRLRGAEADLACGCRLLGTSAPLLAVADLHGDLKQAFKALLLAGAVDEQGAWSGGGATLVQTGDMVDRGPESLAVVALLERLKARLQPRHHRMPSAIC
jgi:hypothetical protein